MRFSYVFILLTSNYFHCCILLAVTNHITAWYHVTKYLPFTSSLRKYGSVSDSLTYLGRLLPVTAPLCLFQNICDHLKVKLSKGKRSVHSSSLSLKTFWHMKETYAVFCTQVASILLSPYLLASIKLELLLCLIYVNLFVLRRIADTY